MSKQRPPENIGHKSTSPKRPSPETAAQIANAKSRAEKMIGAAVTSLQTHSKTGENHQVGCPDDCDESRKHYWGRYFGASQSQPTFELVCDPSSSTIGVTTVNLRTGRTLPRPELHYNPFFISERSIKELRGILAHEAGHIKYGHFGREMNMKLDGTQHSHTLMNRAGDALINYELEQDGIPVYNWTTKDPKTGKLKESMPIRLTDKDKHGKTLLDYCVEMHGPSARIHLTESMIIEVMEKHRKDNPLTKEEKERRKDKDKEIEKPPPFTGKVNNHAECKNCGKGEPNQVERVGHASPLCLFKDIQVFGGV
jgi:hypothetical protein